MGIKNLSHFLKKYDTVQLLDMKLLKFSKIGIDTPMFLYKFKSKFPDSNEWLSCFVNFVSYLRKWDVHPTFVFEGKAPPEKSATQEQRRESKLRIKEKTNSIHNDLVNFIENGIVTPLLSEFQGKTIVKSKVDVDFIQKEINLEALHYLMHFGYIPSPISIYKNIYKLSPGFIAKFSKTNSAPEIYPYWQLENILKDKKETVFFDEKK